MAEIPENLLYTKEHEWIRLSADKKSGVVGITAFAVEQLGDVTMIELPDEGSTIAKDETFGTVESVKAVSDLFAPVSGKVLRINTPLNDSPEYVNEAPYDEGWLVEIELSAPAELDGLMNPEAYKAFVEEQD
ncbi:MAG TPA: glycine cleavage system protein GcvH [Kofleriaceae bacterium]|nr:glycine cleavage system protein GcvH [Kofleriaceae bacterium]